MIYPSARAVGAAILGGPPAVAAGVAIDGGWVLAAAWLAALAALILADMVLGPAPREVELDLETPPRVRLGSVGSLTLTARFPGPAPAAWGAVATSDILGADPARFALAPDGAAASGRTDLAPQRRGLARISEAWVRWRGPLGLVWKQVRLTPDRTIAVTADIEGVKAQALRFFARDATFGVKTQLDVGHGSEFHALREVQGAVDPRTIDWKQTARHARLLAKEFRSERNHPVIAAIDAGAGMSAPIGGQPRIDRAIGAALLLAYVALKMGDMAGVYGFDARPQGFSGLVSGAAAFPRLQHSLAALDYSAAETNYTLALAQLGALLGRRSLIVVFTEVQDPTSAELMLENLARLLRRHAVLFVTFRDEELEALARAEPVDALALTRAATAHALLETRRLVLARLERMGVRVVDAPAATVGPALVSAYLDLVRGGTL